MTILRQPARAGIAPARGAILAWTVGVTLLGLLLGSAVGSLGDQLDTPAFRELTTIGGGDPGEVFFRFVLYVLSQVVTASAIAAALRLRGQEPSGLADVLQRGAAGPATGCPARHHPQCT
jgi:ABC-2 type transport system permease protein